MGLGLAITFLLGVNHHEYYGHSQDSKITLADRFGM